ncbi:MAG: hypothetical protein HY429_02525 [Candidatus Levybacteria bacterium]|nr:hypothetical protein [Candidatus Levybacteria bacterium]
MAEGKETLGQRVQGFLNKFNRRSTPPATKMPVAGVTELTESNEVQPEPVKESERGEEIKGFARGVLEAVQRHILPSTSAYRGVRAASYTIGDGIISYYKRVKDLGGGIFDEMRASVNRCDFGEVRVERGQLTIGKGYASFAGMKYPQYVLYYQLDLPGEKEAFGVTDETIPGEKMELPRGAAEQIWHDWIREDQSRVHSRIYKL